MDKMKKMIYSATLILTLSLAACSNEENYSPQEILNQAMQETSELDSYYGEYKTTMDDGTEMLSKQWEKKGKTRVEMVDSTGEESITVNDGKTLTSYSKTTNEAMIFELGPEVESLVRPTLKEQALNTLEQIKNSHDITIGEEEKIAGHETYHLIAKAKKQNTLIGDMEIWVDKKTWMTLKTISASGDMKITSEFTKFEPNSKIDDAKFSVDIPEDAVVKVESFKPLEQLTVEQAVEKIGPFLIFPESLGYTMEGIEDMGVTDTGEIALTYSKNGDKQFSLSIFKPIQSIGEEEELIEVRGQKGSKIELGTFKTIQWDEEGLRYNVILENPDLTFEEILQLTEKMEIIK
ncbi:hypothetical protein A9986_16430 [Solibacillus silvestris]|nr:hypothetical protein A9986_16430 [Solibacillus silvestris]